jgi:altronate dehydratase small subunit
MTIDAIMINDKDNVATALRDIQADELVTVNIGTSHKRMQVREDISYGHKFATKDIKKGGLILKYGETIGRAMNHIDKGAHAHIHNIESLRGRGDLAKEVN